MRKITSLLLLTVMFFSAFAIAPAPVHAAGGAENYPLNSIVIKIEDIVTHQMLGGARFEIYYSNDQMSGGYGTLVATVDSDGSGVIVISGIPSGYYIVRQTVPPNNYHLSINNEQHCFIKADGTSIEELVFSNYRYGGLVVILDDKDTGEPIPGATFSVTDVENKAVGNHADGIYTTDSRGEFFLENLPAGDYKITQLTAAQGYALDSAPSTRTIRLQHTNADQSVFMAQFSNSPLGTLLVRLKDSVSKEPLTGAVFNVKLSGGEDLGEFTTGADGSFTLPKIARGTYIISQVSAPSGYLLATSTKSQYVNYVNTYAVDFENQPKSGLYVTKYDKDTKEPLKDAKFHVYQNSTLLGTYTTNADGVFFISDINPGWYTVSEFAAPQGYILDDTPKSVQVIAETLHVLEFENAPMSSLIIRKVDADTRDPLEGAEFTVRTASGTFIGTYRSGTDGMVTISQIDPGWYTVTETKSPDGYTLGDNVQTVEITNTKTVTIEFQNRAFGSLVIKKIDEITGNSLTGAEFSVYKQGGAFVGEYTTGIDGTISIPSVEPGWYSVSETKAPAGYTLDSTAKTVEVKPVVPSIVTFSNKPLSGIEIIKTDSVTHNPLLGATFVVEKANGEKIGTYKTDVSGKVLVTGLTEGTYVVSETIAPDGYHLNETPKTVIVTSGKLTTAEFTNKPYSGIQILKTDAVTNAPLQGAVFKVERVNGERIGDKYTTDIAGKVIVSDLEEGIYILSEIQAPAEYILDAQPQTVEVKSGKLTIAEFVNTPYPYLHIVKTDASTGQLLSGAEFVITNAYGEIIANVTSQASGAVSLKVAPGVYTVTETKAPAGYELNDPVQRVEVKANGSAVYYGTNTIYPNNSAIFGNKPLNAIQILKLDSITHNPLSKALFVVDKSNGERIGSFLTDTAGSILISGLTEGTYIIKETSAPEGYQLDETPKTINISGGKTVDVDFLNKPLSGIQITKLDSVTRLPLKDATFAVTKPNGEKIGTFRTESDGTAVIPNLEEGTYTVSEVSAPSGYQLDETPKNVNVVTGKLATIEFTNKPYSGIQILKTDAVTHVPLENATFTVDRSNGERIGIYKTDTAGQVLVPDLAEGTYIISETAAPNGYQLDQTPKTVTVVSGRITEIEFTNVPYGSLVIKKTDEIDGRPLAGAHFTVTHQGGASVGDFVTGNDGTIAVPSLEPGWYVISETKAPTGYHLDNAAKTIEIKSHAPTSITFTNRPYSGIEIIKADAVTHAPLAGATFTVTRSNGENIGSFKTDTSGKIVVPDLKEGTYIVSETIAPDGYQLDETPKTVTVTSGKLTTVEFTNKPHSGITITKIDAVTKAPLMGATFIVERPNGEKIGTYKTDAAGKIIVSDLTEGTYIVSETIAPDGYQLDETPKSVVVTSGKITSALFTNKPHSGIIIYKYDTETKAPLTGASFLVERDNGERIGTYKTDNTGKIIISNLTEGTYIVSETAAPDGYILDEAPKTVVVKSGKVTETEFFNKPLAGLRIVKLDSATRNPIQGVIFEIAKMSGEKVENDFRGYNFTTDKTGQIYIPNLPNGHYVVTETKSADGYILDGEPKTVSVESGKITVLEVLNTPMSGLLIVKTDSVTRKPIAGVVFDVKRADGSFVAGNILDGNQPNTENNSPNKTTSANGDITGSYTTDANGRILINGLAAGQYNVIERKAADGYELDTEVHNVTVTPGKLVTLQITNKPKGGLRITKIDSVTKKPIFNVEFMLFDANNKVVGVYYTDNNGVIDFPTDIPAGRYTIRETRAAEGYYLDETPKTVEFVAGKVTEITWTNVPQMGQIQITKKAGDDNEVNGLPAGSPLAGAVFEVYNQKTGNLMDRFVSGNDGRAVSSPLPIGRYIVKEVQAPQYYKLSDKELDITIEFATQIIKEEFLNYAANTGVYIKKTGNVEAMPGDLIRYDIKAVQNTGSVPLTDFFWRDVLPVDAVRLNKIVTGTYNQSLKYKIIAMTNKGDTKIIADNLSTTKNNVIDCSPASLGLRNDEFVTNFTLVFGTVKAGFAQVETPQVYVNVLKTLPNGYQFANKCDIGGKYGNEWVIGNSTCVTKIFSNSKLPKTGY